VGRGRKQGHVWVSRQDSVSRAAEIAPRTALQLPEIYGAVPQGRVCLFQQERRPAESERRLRAERTRWRAGSSARSEQAFRRWNFASADLRGFSRWPLRRVWRVRRRLGLAGGPRHGSGHKESPAGRFEVAEIPGLLLGRQRIFL